MMNRATKMIDMASSMLAFLSKYAGTVDADIRIMKYGSLTEIGAQVVDAREDIFAVRLIKHAQISKGFLDKNTALALEATAKASCLCDKPQELLLGAIMNGKNCLAIIWRTYNR